MFDFGIDGVSQQTRYDEGRYVCALHMEYGWDLEFRTGPDFVVNEESSSARIKVVRTAYPRLR